MIVPLTTQDFLARGATVYPDRVAVVDEPEQPAGSVGELTFAEVQARARAVAAGLDAMGVAAGERIAVVGQNSARMLDLFYGATGSGRIVVPINFRLGRNEVDYIVRHSGASLLLVDPELELPLAAVRAPRRLTLGSESDAALLRFGVEPRPWNDVDENATATINYTSGTTARPKGVELTHRSIWLNATVMACTWASPIATCTCTACRCSTSTAGACRSRWPRSACPRSCCARSMARRSFAASHGTA